MENNVTNSYRITNFSASLKIHQTYIFSFDFIWLFLPDDDLLDNYSFFSFFISCEDATDIFICPLVFRFMGTYGLKWFKMLR